MPGKDDHNKVISLRKRNKLPEINCCTICEPSDNHAMTPPRGLYCAEVFHLPLLFVHTIFLLHLTVHVISRVFVPVIFCILLRFYTNSYCFLQFDNHIMILASTFHLLQFALTFLHFLIIVHVCHSFHTLCVCVEKFLNLLLGSNVLE
jgi:hypothetical protein